MYKRQAARSQSVSYPSGRLGRFEVKWFSAIVLNGLEVSVGWLSEGELLLPMVLLIMGRISGVPVFIRGSADVPAVTCSPSK